MVVRVFCLAFLAFSLLFMLSCKEGVDNVEVNFDLDLVESIDTVIYEEGKNGQFQFYEWERDVDLTPYLESNGVTEDDIEGIYLSEVTVEHTNPSQDANLSHVQYMVVYVGIMNNGQVASLDKVAELGDNTSIVGDTAFLEVTDENLYDQYKNERVLIRVLGAFNQAPPAGHQLIFKTTGRFKAKAISEEEEGS